MSTQQQIERLSGWGAFAAIVMFSVGFFRLISGISYLADSRKVNDLSLGLFGDSVWAWGIWDLGIGIAALFAAYSLLVNGTYGKIVAYLWAVLVIVNSFLIIGDLAVVRGSIDHARRTRRLRRREDSRRGSVAGDGRLARVADGRADRGFGLGSSLLDLGCGRAGRDERREVLDSGARSGGPCRVDQRELVLDVLERGDGAVELYSRRLARRRVRRAVVDRDQLERIRHRSRLLAQVRDLSLERRLRGGRPPHEESESPASPRRPRTTAPTTVLLRPDASR